METSNNKIIRKWKLFKMGIKTETKTQEKFVWLEDAMSHPYKMLFRVNYMFTTGYRKNKMFGYYEPDNKKFFIVSNSHNLFLDLYDEIKNETSFYDPEKVMVFLKLLIHEIHPKAIIEVYNENQWHVECVQVFYKRGVEGENTKV